LSNILAKEANHESVKGYDINDLSVDNILDIMNQLTEGRQPQTKCARFTIFLAFFNFGKNDLDPNFIKPCDSPMLRKLFRTIERKDTGVTHSNPISLV
jgi:hypothetical protein